jgi:hypothetical protein
LVTPVVIVNTMSKKPAGSAMNCGAEVHQHLPQWRVLMIGRERILERQSVMVPEAGMVTADPNNLLSTGPESCTMPPASNGCVPSVALSEKATSQSPAPGARRVCGYPNDVLDLGVGRKAHEPVGRAARSAGRPKDVRVDCA